MKILCRIFLGLFLLWSYPAGAEPSFNGLPYHFAVIMPADLVERLEYATKKTYEGVQFPVFCGYASVYPRENRFVFTKTTSLPITEIERFMRSLEKDPSFTTPAPAGCSVRTTFANEVLFFSAFQFYMDNIGFNVVYLSEGDGIPLNTPPLFKRTCPYNSRKDPPVSCGYHSWDIDDLRISYAGEKDRPSIGSPYHVAVVMSAGFVEHLGPLSQKAYDGVYFPLLCGYGSVYPGKNRFVFTKTTRLPIGTIEKYLRKLEKDGYLAIHGHPSYRVPVKDKNFFWTLQTRVAYYGIDLVRISDGDKLPPNAAPRFKRRCPYNPGKIPPVDCGLTYNDIQELLLPYPWERKN